MPLGHVQTLYQSLSKLCQEIKQDAGWAGPPSRIDFQSAVADTILLPIQQARRVNRSELAQGCSHAICVELCLMTAQHTGWARPPCILTSPLLWLGGILKDDLQTYLKDATWTCPGAPLLPYQAACAGQAGCGMGETASDI